MQFISFHGYHRCQTTESHVSLFVKNWETQIHIVLYLFSMILDLLHHFTSGTLSLLRVLHYEMHNSLLQSKETKHCAILYFKKKRHQSHLCLTSGEECLINLLLRNVLSSSPSFREPRSQTLLATREIQFPELLCLSRKRKYFSSVN